MRFLAVSILAIVPFAPAAHGASFDCAKASTEIERMVCGDADLSALDGLLGDRYVRALAKAENPATVQSEQRAWLRGPRAACADIPCLNAAYEARIVELTKTGWMTDEKARAICERVAGAMVDRSYQSTFRRVEPGEKVSVNQGPGLQGYRFGEELEIDYDSDGRFEKLDLMFSGGGTCQSYNVSMIVDVTDGKPDHNPLDDLNWQEGLQQFLVVDGEPVLARTPNDRESYLHLDWLTPAGGELPLCGIAIKYVSHLKTVKSENPALCQAVAQTSVEFLPWKPASPETHKNFDKIMGYADELSRVVLDIDLDGDEDTVVQIVNHSTAGCGYTYRWLAEARPDLTSIDGFALNKILMRRKPTGRLREWAPTYGSPNAEWDQPRVFLHGGKPYILGKSVGTDAVVVSLWGGVEKEWCRYQYPRQPSGAQVSMAPQFD